MKAECLPPLPASPGDREVTGEGPLLPSNLLVIVRDNCVDLDRNPVH